MERAYSRTRKRRATGWVFCKAKAAVIRVSKSAKKSLLMEMPLSSP